MCIVYIMQETPYFGFQNPCLGIVFIFWDFGDNEVLPLQPKLKITTQLTLVSDRSVVAAPLVATVAGVTLTSDTGLTAIG